MNKHNILAVITFITGIILSGVCAFFSILGLTALFSGAFWPVVIMGTILEIAKLVTVSWIYHNYKSAPMALTTYLCTAVVLLMLITSMGIFGFLSKSHLEQQLVLNTGLSDQISIVQNKIATTQESIADIEKQIDRIDSTANTLLQKGQAKSADSMSSKNKKDRELLVKNKDENVALISSLKEEKIKLESNYKKLEAEVGPVKYIAELIYDDAADTKILDKAVRAVIIILIIVFDPLAIGLLLAFNVSLNQRENTPMEYLDVQKEIKRSKKKHKPQVGGGTF